MKQSQKVIISCAITGSIHTPSMSPHLPATPDEIVNSALEAAEAGAAILHLHARDPETGRPSQDPELFGPILQRISDGCDAVLNITTGGSPHMAVAERFEPARRFEPELASLNMGSMNFGLFPMLGRFREFRFNWEREHLEKSVDLIFRNTFADIEAIMRSGAEAGTRFEFECYDIGHLYTLRHFADRGLIEAPYFIQSVMGILGGIGTDPEDIMQMKRTAERLFGNDFVWSVVGAGRAQMPTAAIAAATGGNIRVGLEDSLWEGKGRLSPSNASQVRRARKLVEALGREVATAQDAREILALKGNVG